MTNSEKFNFEELKVYHKALAYIEWVYNITNKFPDTERYNLTSQFRRASQSIALNIAEGSISSKLQFSRFLKISKGSLCECIVCTTIAKNLTFISSDIENESRTMLIEISKMLSGLIQSLK